MRSTASVQPFSLDSGRDVFLEFDYETMQANQSDRGNCAPDPHGKDGLGAIGTSVRSKLTGAARRDWLQPCRKQTSACDPKDTAVLAHRSVRLWGERPTGSWSCERRIRGSWDMVADDDRIRDRRSSWWSTRDTRGPSGSAARADEVTLLLASYTIAIQSLANRIQQVLVPERLGQKLHGT